MRREQTSLRRTGISRGNIADNVFVLCDRIRITNTPPRRSRDEPEALLIGMAERKAGMLAHAPEPIQPAGDYGLAVGF
jgi:hypothetical protein